MSAENPAPSCSWCGKKLRRYRFRMGGPTSVETNPSKQWGDYGDGFFCGQTCGFRWAVWKIKGGGR